MSRAQTPSYDTSSSPSSDPDPYASSGAGARSRIYTPSSELPSTIDDASLSRGLPVLGPFSGYTVAWRNRLINKRFLTMSSELKRPLTDEEQAAIAYHTARALSIASCGPTVGFALGLARWWRTRYEMRWLWLGTLRNEAVNVSPSASEAWPRPPGPGMSLDAPPNVPLGGGTGNPGEAPPSTGSSSSSSGPTPESEASQGSKPPRSGFWTRTLSWDGSRLWAGNRELLRSWQPARREAVLQGFRALPYIGLGWVITTLLFGTIATSVDAAGELSDPRLKNLVSEMRSKIETAAGLKQPKTQTGGSQRSPDSVNQAGPAGRWRERRDPTGQGARSSGELWRGHRDAIQRGEVSDSEFIGDDASPSSFSPNSDSDSFSNDNTSSSSSMGRYDSGQSRNIYERRRGGSEQRQSSSFDDDSPTGGMGGTDDFYASSASPSAGNVQGRGGGSGGASSWDRIRQQTRTSQTNPNPNADASNGSSGNDIDGRGVGGGGGGDDFTYSSTDEERTYARDEAQREFDARVERERRGRDF